MATNETELIELALQNRFMTRKHAELIREDLAQNPKESVGNLMLRRHYITEEQLDDLRRQAAGGGADEDMDAAGVATVRGMPPRPAEPAPNSPPKQLSVPPRPQPALEPPTNPTHKVAATPPPVPAPPPRAAAPVAPAPPPPAAPAPKPAPPAPAPAPAPAPQRAAASGGDPNMPKNLSGFLRLARHWGCSDLHLSTGKPPFVRLNGQLRYMEMDSLTPEKSEELNFSALSTVQLELAKEHQQLDFALEIPAVGRHRCNIFKQRLGWDGVYRIVRATVPTFEELNLPASLRVLTEYNQGLVLVTGPGGSGKTTTCAAMLDLVNTARQDHIITVEDPVEFVMTPKNCQVMQREVGRHTQSFANALRAALREDPDIILIGEMRGHETISIAISAAETGHLVFGTLHTSSTSRTVARIVDAYPVNQQAQICTMVAESLRGVIAQQLVPRKDNNGAALALEILINTPGVSQQIKEGKTHMILSLIQSGKKYGMMMMEESLMNLYKSGAISGREAYRRANVKQSFEAIKEEA